MVVYASRGVLLVGVIIVVLAAFGVGDTAPVKVFELGVAVCFAAGLVPARA
jgi:hypothetical protein